MPHTSPVQRDLKLVARDALQGITVGVSVSDSADLPRLGLTPEHCALAVAELARAIFLAGGTIVYGGRLIRGRFTDIMIDELRRYGDDRDALILCVPESEHRLLTNEELIRREQELHSSVKLVCLDQTGTPINISARFDSSTSVDVATALTSMRQHITDRCDARVIVGGKLRGFQGSAPGVIEEALLSVQAHQPLYIAGGFGGAAAAVAQSLDRDGQAWHPSGFPEGVGDHEGVLRRLLDAYSPPPDDGLTDGERLQLAATHRPGDISSLVVTGLGRFATNR